MKHILRIALVPLLSCQVFAQSAKPVFEPVTPRDQPLYRLNFSLFYPDEAARKKDLAEVDRLSSELLALNPEIRQDPAALQRALELTEHIGHIVDRLESFGGLRQAVNTEDTAAQTLAKQGEDARTKIQVDTAFIKTALQGLSQVALDKMLATAPGLQRYAYYIEDTRRTKPHTASEDVEAALSQLTARLDPFRTDFYTLMGKRSLTAKLVIDGQEMNVMNASHYAQLQRNADASVRERAFMRRLDAYRSEGDLYAFALLEKARTANAVADFRHFGNAVDASLFDHHLNAEVVDVVLKQFREHANLALRFQMAERVYQQKLLGLPTAEPWDLEARPANSAEPVFTIREGSQAVLEATQVFGADYQDELRALLNASNGRMDIVRGPNRGAGDFSWGYDATQVFYMQGYNGYLADVVTLAHEAAHVVHYSLIHKNHIPWFYVDGPRFFTEGFAKINELLILDQLAKTAKSDDEKVFYLRAIASKLASVKFTAMYWAALATNFEIEVYRRVKVGTVQTPAGIHEVWGEYGRLWSNDFTAYPDMKYTWADTHHFFDTSRYYSNYLFAWVFALAVYERVQSDPQVADKFVSLMKAGFSDEPAILLKSYLDINLADPAALERMFAVVESKVSRFEEAVGVKSDK